MEFCRVRSEVAGVECLKPSGVPGLAVCVRLQGKLQQSDSELRRYRLPTTCTILKQQTSDRNVSQSVPGALRGEHLHTDNRAGPVQPNVMNTHTGGFWDVVAPRGRNKLKVL